MKKLSIIICLLGMSLASIGQVNRVNSDTSQPRLTPTYDKSFRIIDPMPFYDMPQSAEYPNDTLEAEFLVFIPTSEYVDGCEVYRPVLGDGYVVLPHFSSPNDAKIFLYGKNKKPFPKEVRVYNYKLK